jgi:Glycosyltransferase family 87
VPAAENAAGRRLVMTALSKANGSAPLISKRTHRASGRAVVGLFVLVLVCGLGALAALVPVGHGFAPRGGGLFVPSVVGGVFTQHPLLVAVPWAACFVLGLLDPRRPWQVGHLDLLALAGFFPVAMLLSDDLSPAGLWLAAVCLGWLFARMLGAALGAWRLPELRPSISSRRLGLAVLVLLAVRIGSLAGGDIADVGRASSLGAWRVLHGLPLYGAVSWQWPGGVQIYHPDSYGPFAYYAYLPFAAVFRPASALVPAVLATLVPAVCFDLLTLAGLCRLGRRLGGRPLARAFAFAYLLYPFPDLSLMAETNDALIAALCVWAVVAGTERPAARGLLMAAVALTKFLPALLALQFLGVRPGRWRYALTLAASLTAMLAWPLITSGPARFLESTLGYQLVQRGGGAQFSIWTYLPHSALVARAVLAAALVLLALSPMLRPPVRDPRKDAALAAALLIGAQLLLGYWFYSYLTWCYPLLIIAIIAARPDQEATDGYPPLA